MLLQNSTIPLPCPHRSANCPLDAHLRISLETVGHPGFLCVLIYEYCEFSNTALFTYYFCLLYSRKSISLLVLLDLCAVLDTIDYDILIDRLQNYTGIQGQALRWFRSYLSNRYFIVHLNGESSQLMPVKYAEPQGYVLGPLLFSKIISLRYYL